MRFRDIAGFAVLVSRSRQVAIDGVQVTDSGSRNPAGRNNTTGGILLEEGTGDFRVTRCEFRNIRGNGVWTHSLYTSPRNARGVFADNASRIGRDALQVGHATECGWKEIPGGASGIRWKRWRRGLPVALDTAGNVDRSVYARNQFTGINGKCIDLDGFHDGEVPERLPACRRVRHRLEQQQPRHAVGHVRMEDNWSMEWNTAASS